MLSQLLCHGLFEGLFQPLLLPLSLIHARPPISGGIAPPYQSLQMSFCPVQDIIKYRRWQAAADPCLCSPHTAAPPLTAIRRYAIMSGIRYYVSGGVGVCKRSAGSSAPSSCWPGCCSSLTCMPIMTSASPPPAWCGTSAPPKRSRRTGPLTGQSPAPWPHTSPTPRIKATTPFPYMWTVPASLSGIFSGAAGAWVLSSARSPYSR